MKVHLWSIPERPSISIEPHVGHIADAGLLRPSAVAQHLAYLASLGPGAGRAGKVLAIGEPQLQGQGSP